MQTKPWVENYYKYITITCAYKSSTGPRQYVGFMLRYILDLYREKQVV